MWEAAGDMKGVQRTLELAHRSAPDDTAIHARLEKWYRDRELWAELAELMTKDAERLGDTPAVERLREAASVYSGFLGQPLKAAEVLRRARQRAPNVPELVTDHAAQRAIGEALATVKGKNRVTLLLLRANFRQQLGDDASAVQDLTEAYELDRDSATETLVAGLEKLRLRAERDGDLPTERTATLRLAQMLTQHGELERGRAFLVSWIERDPRDAEPLYLLCDLDESIQHWDGVAAAATRLAYITESDQQVQAALRATTALTNAGRPADAVPVLELVHQHQPAVEVLRDKLRDLRGRRRVQAPRRGARRGCRPRQRCDRALRELQARRRAVPVSPRGRVERAAPRGQGARAPARRSRRADARRRRADRVGRARRCVAHARGRDRRAEEAHARARRAPAADGAGSR